MRLNVPSIASPSVSRMSASVVPLSVYFPANALGRPLAVNFQLKVPLSRSANSICTFCSGLAFQVPVTDEEFAGFPGTEFEAGPGTESGTGAGGGDGLEGAGPGDEGEPFVPVGAGALAVGPVG